MFYMMLMGVASDTRDHFVHPASRNGSPKCFRMSLAIHSQPEDIHGVHDVGDVDDVDGVDDVHDVSLYVLHDVDDDVDDTDVVDDVDDVLLMMLTMYMMLTVLMMSMMRMHIYIVRVLDPKAKFAPEPLQCLRTIPC